MIRRPPISTLFPYTPLSRSQMQQRRVQVVDENLVLGRVPAVVVGRAVPEARLDSAAGQPDGEPLRVVVPAVPAPAPDRKSTRLNSSHSQKSDSGFCFEKKTK